MKKLLLLGLFFSQIAYADVSSTQAAAPPVSISNSSVPIELSDSPSIDATGRFRTSQPYPVFGNSLTDDDGSLLWFERNSGAGSSGTWNSNEATYSLTVGTGATDYEYRQTKYYFVYTEGRTVDVDMTFLFGAGVSNVIRRVGLFDDNDGIFLQQSGSTLSVCLRTSTSGTPVDTCYDQANWNLDTLDASLGKNPSRLTLDITKVQLVKMDFIWQGVGRIRYGFNIDGKVIYVHQILNANVKTLPFMASATLPMRYEIRNAAASVGASMKQICVSLNSEGGYTPPGLEFGAGIPITTLRTISATTPVMAIRLINTFNGKPVRKTVNLLHLAYVTFTNDAACELRHIHDPTATVGGTWVPESADSVVEYNLGLTSITATKVHAFDPTYAIAGLGSAGGNISASINWNNYHSIIVQNPESNQSEIFAVYCTPKTGSADIGVAMGWLEE